MYGNTKKGFTLVEIIIIIAVIAVLIAVLFPSILFLIDSANRSSDIQIVNNLNKTVAVYQTINGKSADFSEVEKRMEEGGFYLPISKKSSDRTIFWVPEKNMSVLYDTENEVVDYPAECSELTKSDTWINLCEEYVPVVNPTPDDPTKDNPTVDNPTVDDHTVDDPTVDDPTEDDPPEEDEPTDRTLFSGSKFNAAIKNLASDATSIVFAQESSNKDIASGSYVALSEDGGIKGYVKNKVIYVLNNGAINAPADASNMFSEMTSLTSVDMTGVNISTLTKTDKMFYNCSSLQHIYSSSTNWKTGAITSSDNMFEGATKLPYYSFSYPSEPSGIGKFFDDIISAFVNRNIDYAHTGEGGYLS